MEPIGFQGDYNENGISKTKPPLLCTITLGTHHVSEL